VGIKHIRRTIYLDMMVAVGKTSHLRASDDWRVRGGGLVLDGYLGSQYQAGTGAYRAEVKASRQ